jgi:hypothetical protein
MSVDPELIKGIDEARACFERQISRIARPEEKESGRFYCVMKTLTGAAISNYDHIRRAYDASDEIMMAWFCRNLLEILIWSRFVLRSRQYAEDFATDGKIDALQVQVLMQKLGRLFRERSHSKEDAGQKLNDSSTACGEVTINLDDSLWEYLKEKGISRRHPLHVRMVAEMVGLKDEYEVVNRLCSKLVHPTAWSLIAAHEGQNRMNRADELFVQLSMQYFMSIFDDGFLPHIRQWGLRHKPPAEA